jgi:hypothetical protein
MMGDDAQSTSDIDLFAGEKRVHEVELAKHGDHHSHENELVVFVVASSQKEAAVKACDVQIEKRPNWHTEETSWLHRGSSSMDSAEWRQFIDDSQDDVLFGSEVPV